MVRDLRFCFIFGLRRLVPTCWMRSVAKSSGRNLQRKIQGRFGKGLIKQHCLQSCWQVFFMSESTSLNCWIRQTKGRNGVMKMTAIFLNWSSKTLRKARNKPKTIDIVFLAEWLQSRGDEWGLSGFSKSQQTRFFPIHASHEIMKVLWDLRDCSKGCIVLQKSLEVASCFWIWQTASAAKARWRRRLWCKLRRSMDARTCHCHLTGKRLCA